MFLRIVRPVVGAVVAAVALVSAPSSTAFSAPAATVTTQERGCTEQAFNRNLIRDAVDPLIPDDYELTPTSPAGAPARVAGLINVVTCSQVTTDGPAAAYFAHHPTTTTFIYSATLLDGTSYVLLFATDNPVLAARYGQLGWPVQLLGPKTGTAPGTDAAGGAQRRLWGLHGAGWDGVVDGSVPATLNPAGTSTFELVHQSEDTVLHLCYANVSSVTSNTVWFDLSRTPVADLAAVSVLPTDFQFAGWYITGDQTATLTTESCPA